MKTKCFLIVALVSVVCFTQVLAQTRPQIRTLQFETYSRTIAIMADSIWWQTLKKAAEDGILDPTLINLAFPGSTVGSLNARLKSKVPENTAIVIVAIGTNNFILLHQAPDEISGEIYALLDAVRKKAPLAKIVLQSILPTRAGDHLNQNIFELNQMLRRMAEKLSVIYWDIHGEFAEQDGLTGREDLVGNLHLTDGGRKKLYSLFVSDIIESGETASRTIWQEFSPVFDFTVER